MEPWIKWLISIGLGFQQFSWCSAEAGSGVPRKPFVVDASPAMTWQLMDRSNRELSIIFGFKDPALLKTQPQLSLVP
jgi:hypothetical protein